MGFFFENVAGQTTSMNDERYTAMIPQNEATAHTARPTTEILMAVFLSCQISHFSDLH